MKKTFKHFTLLLALACACTLTGLAQTMDYAGNKEKVYVHTNHVFFKPGETLYFKLYVVNAKDQAPTRLSSVVYADIINPSGNVVQKLNYRVEDGYAEGSFEFNDQAVGGIYKLRAYTTWMRNEKDNTFFVKEITVQKVIAPRLLMKLDFPEKGYGPGDEVKAAFSMRNLSDQPIRNYPAKFTLSIGGEVIQIGSFKTNSEGKSLLTFTLPKTLKTNDGLLNISISYESYTEAISRSIPIVLNKIDLQFMPEGGSFVAGLPTHIAFKALNENGKPVDVKGDVWDNAGNKVASFDSYRFGMGKFAFTPQKGQLYKVKITTPSHIGQVFELPAAANEGVVMNVDRQHEAVSVHLFSTGDREITLAGQTKNTVYYTTNLRLQKGENRIDIPEKLFPAGIATLTAGTTDGLPLAERLVFLHERGNLQVSITPDKRKYQPREKVNLSIKTTDANGQPIPSNLSIAVVDDKLWSFADDKQDHILSWLLMSSELKGKIEEPSFYFKKEEPMAVPALDLVMLTHGYRYFDYIESVEKEGKPAFSPDQEDMLSGVIVDSRDKPVKATIYLVSVTAGEKAIRVNTGDDGLFFFSELAPNTNYYLLAKAIHQKDKISIRLLQNGIGYNPMKAKELRLLASKNGEPLLPAAVPIAHRDELKKAFGKMALADQDKKEMANKELFMPKANAQLNEVVVVGFGAARKKDITGAVAIVNAMELAPANNVAQALQGRVAGLQIMGNANPLDAHKVMIRGMKGINGGGQPLYVLNGVPMESFMLNTLNPNDIESITILKDAAATAIYGGRAAYGVILIESKKYRNEKIRINLTSSSYYASQPVHTMGRVYAVARRFYAPVYDSHDAPERTDFRETIYWNPVVQTDKNGNASVSFYNSDATTTFRAIAEGIGYNGKPGRVEQTYTVQNAMSVDAKIPPYLTVGDKALIPLVIKNNGVQLLTITVGLRLPANLLAHDFTNSIALVPDSARQILIPVEATAALNGKIEFVVESARGKETLVLPISATDKGFPVIQTLAGNKSAEQSFIVNQMIPGSLAAHLKLFKNLEGQLLNGIESMLREPVGCFEQTSSSTYPNIYILKYLRESGKSNPAIEQKALQYIENGYRRLVGFETAQNGFEWFGKTPPHEALTAYGLLEFTDMQQFINVDKQMLARTKAFLMSRRDGNGSFKHASGGYDQFASVPDKIADIYIVYALTQAGIGSEIQPEYQAAVKKALQNNDGYQLSMMALAASNMKNDADYRQLMNALDVQFHKLNLAAQTSVVNSRDASLRVETMSLYALALMRERNPSIGAAAEAISKILGEKTYYGYGSTQATVLALQAIVEYSKLVGSITKDAQIDFTLNGAAIGENNDITAGIKSGTNTFAVRYADKNKTIPYNLEVSYNTLTPPNSAKAELQLATRLAGSQTSVGETVRMNIEVTNTKATLQPMVIAKIGIPAGLAVQPWQLKEIMEKNQVAYYEIFDNYLVFYWMGFAANETKTLALDLKAEIAGRYKAKASNVYLYYTPEYKNWNEGVEVEVK